MAIYGYTVLKYGFSRWLEQIVISLISLALKGKRFKQKESSIYEEYSCKLYGMAWDKDNTR